MSSRCSSFRAERANVREYSRTLEPQLALHRLKVFAGGANAAIFSVVNAILLRPLPYLEPDRLVHVFELDRARAERRTASYPEYLDWRRLNRTFEEIAGYEGGSRTLAGIDGAERVPVAQVTGNFFRMLGVNPTSGHAGRSDRFVAGRIATTTRAGR